MPTIKAISVTIVQHHFDKHNPEILKTDYVRVSRYS